MCNSLRIKMAALSSTLLITLLGLGPATWAVDSVQAIKNCKLIMTSSCNWERNDGDKSDLLFKSALERKGFQVTKIAKVNCAKENQYGQPGYPDQQKTDQEFSFFYASGAEYDYPPFYNVTVELHQSWDTNHPFPYNETGARRDTGYSAPISETRSWFHNHQYPDNLRKGLLLLEKYVPQCVPPR